MYRFFAGKSVISYLFVKTIHTLHLNTKYFVKPTYRCLLYAETLGQLLISRNFCEKVIACNSVCGDLQILLQKYFAKISVRLGRFFSKE